MGKFKHSRACRWARHQEWDGDESGSTGLFEWRGLGGDWGGDGAIAPGRRCWSPAFVPRLRRLRFSLTANPALTRWANFCRAYGAEPHLCALNPQAVDLKPAGALQTTGIPGSSRV